jgi:hypothetical protein
MVAILNYKSNRLGKQGDNLVWSDMNTLSESWVFEIIQKSNVNAPTNIQFTTSAIYSNQ